MPDFGYRPGYGAHKLFGGRKFRVLWCTTWWLGYQSYGDMVGGQVLDVCIIPGIMLSFTWKKPGF